MHVCPIILYINRPRVHAWVPNQLMHWHPINLHISSQLIYRSAPSVHAWIYTHAWAGTRVGDLQWSSDSLEQWREEHGGATSRSHDTHNPNLPHHPLLHQRNWDDGAQPAAKTRQAETRKRGGQVFGLSWKWERGRKKHVLKRLFNSSCFLFFLNTQNQWSEVCVNGQLPKLSKIS